MLRFCKLRAREEDCLWDYVYPHGGTAEECSRETILAEVTWGSAEQAVSKKQIVFLERPGGSDYCFGAYGGLSYWPKGSAWIFQGFDSDIHFAVLQCERFTHNPKMSHL